jgi:hypothetical protein
LGRFEVLGPYRPKPARCPPLIIYPGFARFDTRSNSYFNKKLCLNINYNTI